MTETTSGRKRRRTQKSIQTEQAILQAAKTIFAQQGFDQAHTKEIAQAAGVAEGTVFLYFDNKLGLLQAAMTSVYDQLQTTAEALIHTHTDPFQQLRALAQNHLNSTLPDWTLFRLFSQYGRYGHGDFSDSFYQLNRRYTRLFVTIIDELKATGRIRLTTPTPLIRDTLFGSMEHYLIAHFKHGRTTPTPDQFLDQLLDLLLFGCSAR